jgi:hypothetical protein
VTQSIDDSRGGWEGLGHGERFLSFERTLVGGDDPKLGPEVRRRKWGRNDLARCSTAVHLLVRGPSDDASRLAP